MFCDAYILRRIFIKSKLLIFFLFLSLIVSKTGLGTEIIVHPSVVETHLSTIQLRRIYTMRQVRWLDNSPIVVFVLSSKNQLHQKFSKEILQMFPYQLDRIWHKLTFSGLGVAPIKVDSQEELIKLVKQTPGAIGYADRIDNEEGLHVIKIRK